MWRSETLYRAFAVFSKQVAFQIQPTKERNMKRLFIAVSSVCLGVYSLQAAQAAEKYPVKQIVAIVPVEAGGDGDVLFRPVMEKVSKMLGQPIVIVNKPRASNSTGYRELHNA